MMTLHPTKDVMKSGSYSFLSRTTENSTVTQGRKLIAQGFSAFSLRSALPTHGAPANKRRLILILLYYI